MKLIQRIKAKTPGWAKTAQKWAIGMFVINAGVASLANVPVLIAEGLGAIAAFSLILAGVLQLAVDGKVEPVKPEGEVQP